MIGFSVGSGLGLSQASYATISRRPLVSFHPRGTETTSDQSRPIVMNRRVEVASDDVVRDPFASESAHPLYQVKVGMMTSQMSAVVMTSRGIHMRIVPRGI